MKISTSTCIVFERPDKKLFPIESTLRLAKEAGFHYLDFNFYDWFIEGSPFLTDEWKGWIEKAAEEKEKLGIEFYQCHAFFYNFLDANLSEERKAYLDMLVERSLECSHILGCKVCVSHPETYESSIRSVEKSKEANLQYFSKILKLAEKYDLKIALENMWDGLSYPNRKYCGTPEELMDLVESFQNDRIGICWDFEHAIIMKQDQVEALKLFGDKLLATHVSDTNSYTDYEKMHILPLLGAYDWKPVIRTLKEINYQGAFSLEVSHLTNYMPDELLPAALRLGYEATKYITGL